MVVHGNLDGARRPVTRPCRLPPPERPAARLFTLLPGQIGRYRGNFRFTVTTCACNPSWFYEDWLILIANGEVRSDGFIARTPDHDIDHRVHLYGGAGRARRW